MKRERNERDLTVGRIGRHIAATNGDKIALDDGSQCISYHQLDRQVASLTATLGQFGVSRGDVVSAYLPNGIEYVLTVLAVARAGGVFSPLNPRFRSGELAAIIGQSKPKVVVVDQSMRAVLEQALAMTKHKSQLVVCGDEVVANRSVCSWTEALSTPPGPEPVVDELDYFSLMFTSGTTGVPKGALATHRARMLWVLNACILYSLSEDDTYLGTMPLVHSAGLTFTLMHLYVGGTVHILRDFSPQGYLDLLESRHITSSLVVPTMVVMVLEELRQRNWKNDLSALQRLVTCGSPLQESTKMQVLDRISEHLYDYYGSTESNSMTVLKPRDQRRYTRSVGQPFHNVKIRIVNDYNNDVETGEPGEVLCRNPSLMTEYLDNEEATTAAFLDDWYRTGDIGYLDEAGYLYLVGRKGEMIISGGINIYPAEIENTLMSHPDVLDCAVIGLPDEKWGQCVAAYVVPRDGCQIKLQTLQEHCQNVLADYKKPRILHIVPTLPKNAGGKTVKARLV